MIDYLRGEVRHNDSDFIVLDVNGVGYRIFCASPFSFQQHSGQETMVYIHHHVREDAILLYGFATREEQSLFRSLLEVSGIGPRVAMGVLSAGRPDVLIAAIIREDIAYLIRLPGIGKKSAQRIILDLKDKLKNTAVPIREESGHAYSLDRGDSVPSEGIAAAVQESKEALRTLGFTEAEVDRIWPQVEAATKETDSSDVWMKLALQHLYKGS